MLGQEIGGSRRPSLPDHVLRVPLALVLELEHLGPGEPRDLELGPAVAVHQVHPGHEEADREPASRAAAASGSSLRNRRACR